MTGDADSAWGGRCGPVPGAPPRIAGISSWRQSPRISTESLRNWTPKLMWFVSFGTRINLDAVRPCQQSEQRTLPAFLIRTWRSIMLFNDVHDLVQYLFKAKIPTKQVAGVDSAANGLHPGHFPVLCWSLLFVVQGLSHLFQDSWCNARTHYIDLSFFSFLASLPTLRSYLLALRVAQYGGTQWTTFERIFDLNCCFFSVTLL